MMYQFLMVKNYLNNLVNAVVREEEGQGMAEYGLILALIAVAAVVTMGAFSTQINATFTAVTSTLTDAITP